MAKGNDGNYLQHCVEVEAAGRLTQVDAQGSVHIALAHGMEPCESFEALKWGQSGKLIQNALEEAGGQRRLDERSIVTAYRETKASAEKYPNSAKLLRTVVGVEKLSGGITEIEPAKHAKLARAWSGTAIKTACSSWRREIEAGGILSRPDELRTPWLFTMDPMTYSEESDSEDSDKLHKRDMGFLSNTLIRYIGSGKPGIAAFFVYGVRPCTQPKFWKFMDELAECVGAESQSYWLTHQGGNKNLAGLLFSDTEILNGFSPPCLNVGRERKDSN